MSRASWIRRLFRRRGADVHAQGSEADVAVDTGLASSRAAGGEHEYLAGDRGSVTGTGRTGEFVGQVAGDDLGYAGETGAERRATATEPVAPHDRGPEGENPSPSRE